MIGNCSVFCLSRARPFPLVFVFAMDIQHRLNSAFNPKSVAVVGASDRPGSRGTFVWSGVMNGRRAHEAYPVNPKYKYIGVTSCWPSLAEVPAKIDLAVLAMPSSKIEGLLKECGKLGIPNVLLPPSDEERTSDRRWRDHIAAIAREQGIRLIGPDSMGIMRPSIGLNVSYWPRLPEAGGIGLLSQSGAVAAAVLEYASRAGIGFSTVISSGQESEVTLAEMLDFLVADPQTKIIALHIEALRHPRSFFSALKNAVRQKPVVVLKAGRGANARRLASARLGSATCDEAVFDAALARAGAIRCDRLEEFATTLELFCSDKNPRAGRLAMIGTGLGFALLTADAADAARVVFASYSLHSEKELTKICRAADNVINPLALAADADPEVFAEVLEICLADDNVDGVIVSLSPTAANVTPRTAQLLGNLARNSFKPVIVCWTAPFAEDLMRKAFKRNRLPCFNTPELAALAFANLSRYEALKQLRLTPPSETVTAGVPDLAAARKIVDKVKTRERHLLSEEESAALLKHFGIDFLPYSFAVDEDQAVREASRIGFPVAVKLSADGVAHKTDAGGVILDLFTEDAVRQAFRTIRSRCAQRAPLALFRGVFVQKMASQEFLREVSIRAVSDPILGAAISFSAGGRTGEILSERTVEFIPLTEPLARSLIRRHPVYKAFGNFRGMPAANEDALVKTLLQISCLMSEIPSIAEILVNPLVVDDRRAVALDAVVALCARASQPDARYSHLLAAPAPLNDAQTCDTRRGAMRIRSIRPEDFAAEKRMLARLSQQSAYYRFQKEAADVTDNEIIGFTDIDRDREAAFVVTDEQDAGMPPEIHAVGRITKAPASETAEFGILVETSFQRAGLGSILMQRLEDEARTRGARTLSGWVLKGNDGMAALMSRRGYRAVECPQDSTMLIYSLELTSGDTSAAAA